MENIIQEIIATFYDERDKWLIDQMIQDMNDNPKKYKDAVFYPIEREKVIKLIQDGKNLSKLQTQKAIECLKEVREKLFGTDKLDIVFNIPPIQDAMILIDNKIKELEEGK